MIFAIDSNILIYAHNKSAKYHKAAQSLIIRFKEKGKIAICDFSLIEFFQITTDRRKLRETYTENEAARIIDSLKSHSNVVILKLDEKILNEAFNSVERYGVIGYDIYDHIIAHTCKNNGIKNFYTANTKDFEKYEFLNVINPFEGKGTKEPEVKI